jgi:type III pantothenate kinase
MIAIAVGNTRTRAGLFDAAGLEEQAVWETGADPGSIQAALRGLAEGTPDPAVLIGAVHAAEADRLERIALEAGLNPVARIGRDLPVPIPNALDDDSTVGQDRLLCALAAFNRLNQACIVVDAGTAITVDFVDGVGVFQGGVIAPGLGMMLRSMHVGTAALPDLPYAKPDPARGALGKDTAHAMLLGVTNAARGLVRASIDAFAESYGAYPLVVATGGDAATLFDGDELIDRVIPELQLLGVRDTFAAGLHDPDEGPDA